MRKQFYTLIFLFGSAIAVAQNPTALNLKEGQEIKVTTAMEQNTDMAMGMEMKINTTTTAQMKVEKVTEKYILLSNKITHITTDLDAMGQTQSFDSNKKEDLESTDGEAMKELLGDEKYYSMDRITGTFIAVDKEGNVLPEDKEGEAESMMQMGGIGLKDASKMKSFISLLPANVKPGYTWTDSTEANGIRNITTNTVTKIENGIAYLDLKGITSGTTSMEMQGTGMDIIVNGTFTGTSEVNTKTNLTKTQSITTDISSSVDMMGQTMNMTSKGVTRTTYE